MKKEQNKRGVVQARGETVRWMVREMATKLGLSDSEILRIAISNLYISLSDSLSRVSRVRLELPESLNRSGK